MHHIVKEKQRTDNHHVRVSVTCWNIQALDPQTRSAVIHICIYLFVFIHSLINMHNEA